MIARIRCWWRGCERDRDDPAPAEYARCRHCGGEVSYADEVGDTRKNRAVEWARYWFLRKWLPAKCQCCGGRWRHDESIDHIPW